MAHDPSSLRPLATDPRLGMVIQDRYRIVRQLGEGGMGVVYEGEHLLIKRRVAIKCLHAQYARNADVVTRFHREAMAAASIGNEHIVQVTDMGVLDDGAPFMVLEFLEGIEFEQLIDEQGPQPIERVVHIVCQLCDALTAVHDKGITHRDLKPANIFLVARGETRDYVKVLDFGISKFKRSLDGQATNLTATGSTMGTLTFMAPEQLEGSPDTDHRADIYALGGIMHYALCGATVFMAESAPMLVLKITTEAAPSLSSCGVNVPAEFEHIVLKALAKDPAERFQSAAELKRALLPYRPEGFMTVPPDAPAAPRAGASKLWLGAVIAVALLAALLWWRTTSVPANAPLPLPPPEAGVNTNANTGTSTDTTVGGEHRVLPASVPEQPLPVDTRPRDDKTGAVADLPAPSTDADPSARPAHRKPALREPSSAARATGSRKGSDRAAASPAGEQPPAAPSPAPQAAGGTETRTSGSAESPSAAPDPGTGAVPGSPVHSAEPDVELVPSRRPLKRIR